MRLLNFVRVMMLVLVVGLIGIPVYAQGQQQQRPSDKQQPPTAEQQPPSAQSDSARQPQTLTGKIVESQGHLVFADATTNTGYNLDNEEQFKPYVGKDVTIQATLDAASNTMHVSSINVVSPPK